jgi:glycosyltransferase involved in cell wall biosynthesis
MDKIRVMEMIDRPSLGGGQTALLLLAENLDRSIFEVFVCSGGEGPLAAAAAKKGLRCTPVAMSKRLTYRPVREIMNLLKTYRIDILHTHGGIAGLYGRRAAAVSRTPVIVHTLHGIHYLHYRNPLLKRVSIFLEKRYSRFTSGLILVCQSDFGLAKKHRLAPEGKMFVIPNGLEMRATPDPAGALRKRRELGWEPGRPVIGTVARLHRQKGVGYLLQAAPSVLSAFPDARIVVVGDGPLGRRLRAKARRMGLEDRLFFLGERPDAAELIALFDIFVLPSLWEGLPFVLVEAATLGKPIIATAVDGVNEIIEDGTTGVLVPPRDSEALAGAMIRLLRQRDFASRLAVAAKALIPPRFPLRRMVEQTQNLYLRLYQPRAN